MRGSTSFVASVVASIAVSGMILQPSSAWAQEQVGRTPKPSGYWQCVRYVQCDEDPTMFYVDTGTHPDDPDIACANAAASALQQAKDALGSCSNPMTGGPDAEFVPMRTFPRACCPPCGVVTTCCQYECRYRIRCRNGKCFTFVSIADTRCDAIREAHTVAEFVGSLNEGICWRWYCTRRVCPRTGCGCCR